MEIVKISIADTIKIQKSQLRAWKQVVKEDVFEDLKFWVTWKNDKAKDGWDIRTGDVFITFLTHYNPYYKNEVKEIKELLAREKREAKGK